MEAADEAGVRAFDVSAGEKGAAHLVDPAVIGGQIGDVEVGRVDDGEPGLGVDVWGWLGRNGRRRGRRRPVAIAGRRVVCLELVGERERAVEEGGADPELAVEDGTERELAGRADGLQSALAILHPRQLDQDAAIPLHRDLRFLDRAEVLDPPPHDLDGFVEDLWVAHAFRGGEDDGEASLEVETELRLEPGSQRGSYRSPRDGDGEDERGEQPAPAHAASSPRRSAMARLATRNVVPPPTSMTTSASVRFVMRP